MNYPNLKELIKYHPYSIETFADHANVTVGVLKAAFEGDEELSIDELYRISCLTGFSCSALLCPKLILLDNRRYRHRMMVSATNGKLRSIIKAAEDGSRRAIEYVERHYWNYEDGTTPFWTEFINGEPASYARYWCGNWKMDDCLEGIENEKHRQSKRERTEEISTEDERQSQENERVSIFLESVEKLERFTSAHGESGMLWEVFMDLACLMGEYMKKSKERERRSIQERGGL